MKVLLISGKAGSGKDTVANIFKEILKEKGARVLVTHYADLLKFIVKNYFEWDGKKDKRGRHLLQYVGTDVIREYNPNFWVGFVATMLDIFENQWDVVLIPDCRFPNEYTIMKDKHDTSLIRVVRPGMESKLTEEQKGHSSEVAMDNMEYDFTISNGGSIDDLKEIIAKLCLVFGEGIYDRENKSYE